MQGDFTCCKVTTKIHLNIISEQKFLKCKIFSGKANSFTKKSEKKQVKKQLTSVSEQLSEKSSG